MIKESGNRMADQTQKTGASGMVVSFEVPAQLIKSVKMGWSRACSYWIDDEPGVEITDEVVRLGVERLLVRGKACAATMVQDWKGDDDVYDLVIQLGALGEIRYA